MAKKQSRRSISVKAATYATIRDDCARRALSASEYVEGLIAADHKARGVSAVMPVKDAVREVKREARQEVATAAAALRKPDALDSAKKRIVAALGPIPGIGQHQAVKAAVRRAEARVPLDVSLEAERRFMEGAARAAIARRNAPVKPVVVRSGFDSPGNLSEGRPHGERVGAPDPARGARNVLVMG